MKMKKMIRETLFLLSAFITCLFTLKAGTMQVLAANEEAMIGSTLYGTLEEAIDAAAANDTITVLRDCSVSKTLEVTKSGVTIKSADPDNPATISRDEEFTGKSYRTDVKNALIGIRNGSLTIEDIILDGGAVLDDDFNNTGTTWDSPLVYVDGSCTIKEGAIFQNNYNTDGNESNNTGRSAGAVQVAYGKSLTIEGGTFRKCYTNGSGAAVSTGQNATLTATGGLVENCYGKFGGGIDTLGSAEISGMTFRNNAGRSASALGLHGEAAVSGCTFEGNETLSDSGILGISGNGEVTITGCSFDGNTGAYCGGISVSGYQRTNPVTIRDCSFTGNITKDPYGGTFRHSGDPQIILDGTIVNEGNTHPDGTPCGFYYVTGEAGEVVLGPDFESDSEFVFFALSRQAGQTLVDANTNGITATAAQFKWKTPAFRTLADDDGNIILAEPLPKYNIIYYTNNRSSNISSSKTDFTGYNCEETAVIKGEEMLYDAPNMANFAFDGWNTQWNLTGTDYGVGDEVTLTEDLSLYARWKKVRYTLTYQYNGGEGASGTLYTETENIGTDVSLPEAVKEGYAFTGWYKDAALTDPAGQAGDGFQSYYDATLYAGWEELPPNYTVTFDADGGTAEETSVTVVTGTVITLPDCGKEGYFFTGWYSEEDEDLSIGLAGDPFTVEADITLKARYEANLPTYCTVTYETDGGECPITESTAVKDGQILLPACTREGYDFIGWYTKDADPVLVGTAGDTYTVSADITLKAHFEEADPVMVTITFNAMGGADPSPIEAEQWETIVLPGCEREGYTFLGWYAEEECLNRLGAEGSDMKASMDMTLYALWQEIEPNTFTVTFNPGDGTLSQTEYTIEKGSQVTFPLPERDGYTFSGWYFDDSLTRLAGSAGKKYRVTSDITFYAKWTETIEKEPAESYTVTFDAKGGTAEKSTIKVARGKNIRLPKAEKEGYILTGWFNVQDICVGTAGETYRPEGNITLYARWQTPDKADPEYGKKDPVIHTGYESPAMYFLITAILGFILFSYGSAFRKKDVEENRPEEEHQPKGIRTPANHEKKQQKNRYTIAGLILLAIGITAYLLCIRQEQRDKDLYGQLAQAGRTGETVTVEPEESVMPARFPEPETEEAENTADKPSAIEIPSYDWETLCKINQDTCGWLYLPGSPIDLPVVQAADDSYYLSHSFTGEKNVFGCLFFDKGTAFDDFSKVIYGHSVSSDSDAMFSPLLNFRDEAYFKENRAFYYTEDHGIPECCRVFAAMDYDVKDVEDVEEWDFRERNFETQEAYTEWMEQVKERSLHYREPDREPEKLLILSTCCRQIYGKDGRFLIFLYA